MLTVGDLFSGIGGFSLGLERAGMRTAWFAETDPYASAVLRKHWPGVPNHGDVETIRWQDVERVAVVCGGFPCQAFSSAARGANDVDRDLWPEMFRCIAGLRPTWVIGENVVAINRVALGRVEADLETLGYQVVTFEIPACAVGLDHKRERYWICGYADRQGEPGRAEHAEVARLPRRDRGAEGVGAPHGLPYRMDRLKCLGNSIAPEIAEIIGRAIVRAAA